MPTDSPRNTLMIRLISAAVEPTAARASLPVQRPTTITSAALYNSCNMLVSISGTAKAATFGINLPCVMSSS